MPSPLLLAIEEALAINHSAASRSMIYFTIGYALMMFLSGFISARLNNRRVVITAGSIGVLGLVIVSSASSLAMFRLGLLVFGAGFGLFSPTIISIITSLVVRSDWSRALAINELSPHSGMILAPLLAAALATYLPWRAMFVLVAAVLAVTVAAFGRFTRNVDDQGSAPSFHVIGLLFRKPEFWLLILFFSVALSGVDGAYLLIPTFLVTEGRMNQEFANAIFGLSRFTPILALLIGTLVFHRFGIGHTIAFALIGSGLAILLLGVTNGTLRTILVFLQPTIGALFFPAGFAAMSALLPQESRNIGVSMVLPFSVIIGIGIIPSFLGAMGDHYTFALGFVFIGVAMISVGAIPFFHRID